MDLTNLNKERKTRRNPAIDLSTMMYGKVPPQAKELESAILGAILVESHSIELAMEIIRTESFYVDAHQRVYKACLGLRNRNEPIDILTVVEELKRLEELDMVGGPYYVTSLSNSVVSSANIEAHCRIVHQKYLSRELIRVCGESIGEAYEDSVDPFDLLDDHDKKIAAISDTIKSNAHKDIGTAGIEMVNRVDAMRASGKTITGVPSGFFALDRVTYGWQPEDLIIIAARPSVGKTAFVLNLLANASNDKESPTPAALFSLEMSTQQITQRLASAKSGILLDNISRGRLDETQYNLFLRTVDGFQKQKLYIDDTAAINILEFKARVRRLYKQFNIGIVAVDYLQLMSGTEGRNNATNREQEISAISRGLKALAKELKIPIIALSQLSRKNVDGKRDPQLSDLRESGAIEQDADFVAFLTRPDYEQAEGSFIDPALKNSALLHIKKHRNGTLENIAFNVDLSIQKFYDGSEGMKPFSQPQSNWQPIKPATESGLKIFIQKGTKMNNGEFDEGFNEQ